MTLFEEIDQLYEYVRGSRREYAGMRWTRDDAYGRIERRVRDRPRVKKRDLFRAANNRKVRDARQKQKGVAPPIRVFGKKVR